MWLKDYQKKKKKEIKKKKKESGCKNRKASWQEQYNFSMTTLFITIFAIIC